MIGGALPAALAADWLTRGVGPERRPGAAAPSAAVVEEVAGRWLKELLGIPEQRVVRARDRLPDGARDRARRGAPPRARRAGHDVERDGLVGAPADPRRRRREAPRHDRPRAALPRARHRLRPRGAGRRPGTHGGRRRCARSSRATRRTDDRLRAARRGEHGRLRRPQRDRRRTSAAGAWLHVDGAFGLWAAASPSLRHLTAGVERADSWATDAHKWLNVPYDNGIAFCAHPDAHRAALGIRSAYLIHADPDAARDPVDWKPEHSRRARGFTIYAALRSLGRSGVAELVERSCASAQALAAGLSELPGCEILNEVVLNQVLLRFEDDDATDRVVAAVQASGEAWMGGTVWDDRRAIRISVSSWQTSEDDVERTIAAFAAARGV